MRLLSLLFVFSVFTACDSGSVDDKATTDTEATDSTGDDDDDTDTDEGGDAGLTGLEGYCERYKECGGTYYETAEDCVDATYNYWGDCPEMEAALDAFGDCMMTIDCDDYNPDTYNPANTDCADEWSEVRSTGC